VAVDIQGASVVEPWVKRHGVSFPVAVDTTDAVGAAFGLKAIPVSFLVDEVGIIRLEGGGPTAEFLAQVEAVLAEPVSEVRGGRRGAQFPETIESCRMRVAERPSDADARLELARALESAGDYAAAFAECDAAVRLRPEDGAIAFTRGLVLLRQGKRTEALAELVRARGLDPTNWRIRKQIWALEHPEKFYGAAGIDWAWQKEQASRERD
jgi:tetratricopeptide (TPR) repeat protein